ncbi:inorganic phosphate transporter [Ferviditalea candida]|uniref:Phosphate transporter n=1 Tax=Ferviditalea candida TaxID=3108399 RepID=A0ABU5ZH13_9BACL|nr:anion permease [Paenibacillaceae bacterium T2]
MLTYIAITIGLLLAMNIGGSGAAATMGPAYGSGAIAGKKTALFLVAIGVFLGAAAGSGEVVKTIGKGIVHGDILTIEVVIVILSAATLTLFFANYIGIPLSTSEVAVGAIAGAGIAFRSLYLDRLILIVFFWIAIPAAAFLLGYLLEKLKSLIDRSWPGASKAAQRWKKQLILLLIITGFMEAVSAGMNNAANAVGPLIGAGILEERTGIWLGGSFLAFGAVILGGKVIETNGKKITRLSLIQGSTVSFIGASLVILASLWGFPVPLTQITTSAILGVGTAEKGARLFQKNIIIRILKVWIVSPVMALVISYSLILIVLKPNPYILAVIISVFISTVGCISLYRSIRKERDTFYDQGGGV